MAQLEREAVRLQGRGQTVVHVARGGALVGLIAIADALRPTSAAMVRALIERGVQVAMLTGDNQATAERIAGEIGISTTLAEVLPGQKADKLKELQAQGKRVGMVGDGINDAPALAQADVGIAIGTGTDIAMEASDVTLIRGDLRAVYTAIELARRTMGTIRWNLIWAFGYNVLLIPIAAGALYPITGWLLSPVLASAAMAWSSLSVVLNSLTLRRFKPRWIPRLAEGAA
jgi:P-type E1-E2 ATPase